MPTDPQWLEHRRDLLSEAIRYVEQQEEEYSRDTIGFLEWAKHELVFAEALLRQQRLLEQVETFRRSHAPALVAA